VIGLGGHGQGVPRESGFDITAASEVMAILCLADSAADLRARLNRILVGYSKDNEPVLAERIGVVGAMAAILNEALMPNLVQTTEGAPALVHGGPFANIAHGCNSVIATRTALSLADYVVTEAGFAFDLGGEKFFDLKCRSANLNPAAVVIVATIRALKMHGGVLLAETKEPDPAAVERGIENLAAHLDSAAHFGKPTIVAINQFFSDAPEERAVVHRFCASRGVPCATADVFGAGGRGATELAEKVVAACAVPETPLETLYPLDWPAERKIEEIARVMYGAAGVNILQAAEAKLRKARKLGYGQLPICMAKTQDSLSDNPKLRGRPRGFTLQVRDVEIAAGAGFLVALTGEIMRMPGLPEHPAADRIDVEADGNIIGLA
jgi:formate--tetrahydrofolate ligase